MFYIKNDDMEEMFKKAADNYELNVELAADWTQVRSILQSDDTATVLIKKDEKQRRLYWLWLLLLIPAISIITYKAGFYSSNKKQHNESTSAAKKLNSTLQNKSLEKKNTISKKKASANFVTATGKNTHVVNSERIATHKKKLIAENSQLNSYRDNKSVDNKIPVISQEPQRRK